MGFLILLASVVVIFVARRPRPASAKTGTSLFAGENLRSKQETLTVASYNIQTGKSLEGKRDLRASAQVMSKADLVGVQEVYAAGFDGSANFTLGQTERLASYGKFAWLFSATRRRWFREHRGNAILSKIEISDWRIEMLPDRSGKSFRNMTIAKVNWQDNSFHFINTHLHTREGREQQLARVLQEFSKYPRAILVGDFNSQADEPALANALKDIEITDAIKEAGLDLENSARIDWILTKGFTVSNGHMVDKGISDHPYYQVSLSYS